MNLIFCIVFFLRGIKSLCNEECKICDGDTCLVCVDGYGPETNISHEFYGICLRCKNFNPYCTLCSNDVHVCQRCQEENFTLDKNIYSHTNNKCIACPKNCIKCQGLEYGQCWQCVDGFGPDENQKCAKCVDPNCLNCSKNNNKCTKCPEQFRLTEDGTCEKCEDSNCLSCPDSASTCLYCIEGFCVNPDGKCENISLIADHCMNGNYVGDNFKCVGCQYGFQFDKNRICVECYISHCFICSDISKCGLCQVGYYLSDDRTECIPCSTINDKCTICFDGICYQCEDGLTTTVDNQCVKANTENCVLIENGVCTICDEGYGVDENNNCQKCQIENCLHCGKDYTRCTECLPSKDCEICDSSGTCKKCPKGYVLKDGKCKKCGVDKCEYCPENEDTECYRCIPGYRINHDGCLQCNDINCGECSYDRINCTSCKIGYGFDYRKGSCNYKKCTPCLVENCENCDGNPLYCNKCDAQHPDCFDRTLKDDDNDLYDGECPEIIIESSEEEISRDNEMIDSESIEKVTISTDDKSENDDDNDNVIEERGENDEKKKKLSGGAIAGIVAACIAIVGITVGLLVYFLVFKREKVGKSSSSP